MHHRSPRHARAVLVATLAVAVGLGLTPTLAHAEQADPSPAVGSAAAVPSSGSANARIARKIATRLAAPALGRKVAVRVAGASGGSAVFSKRAKVSMLPASNMKLITAVNAMSAIGMDTRLPTTVVAEGAAGRKAVLVAGGDPVLTSRQLAGLARRSAKALVGTLPDRKDRPAPRTVRLKTFFDDSLFSAPTSAPGWWTSYQPYVVRPVRALVRDGRTAWDTSKDAFDYFSGVLRSKVDRMVADRTDLRVVVRARGRTSAPANAPALARFKGNHLSSAVSWMLLVSDNNIAEMLYRMTAVATGEPGSWQGGARAAATVLGGLGVSTKGLVLADGSGVSRNDRVTAKSLIQLLRRAISPAHPELARLRRLLPVSGVSGTLRAANGRYTTAPSKCARGKISAKTGTLHDTVALSGYTVGADGQDRVFSILVNNRPEHRYSPLATRRAVDTLAATVTGCA
jgi:D-alanyl-D-alanine carboxypeptidase/D-alanyl-D-alanine-endopeptidase (penicillin-binding protein 4)